MLISTWWWCMVFVHSLTSHLLLLSANLASLAYTRAPGLCRQFLYIWHLVAKLVG